MLRQLTKYSIYDNEILQGRSKHSYLGKLVSNFLFRSYFLFYGKKRETFSGCIMYSTTSGHPGISSPPSEGKKYHIRHSAVYMKSKPRVLSLFLQNGWKFKIGLLFCCYIGMTDAFRYALLAFLLAVIV